MRRLLFCLVLVGLLIGCGNQGSKKAAAPDPDTEAMLQETTKTVTNSHFGLTLKVPQSWQDISIDEHGWTWAGMNGDYILVIAPVSDGMTRESAVQESYGKWQGDRQAPSEIQIDGHPATTASRATKDQEPGRMLDIGDSITVWDSGKGLYKISCTVKADMANGHIRGRQEAIMKVVQTLQNTP